jgi:hypothetical protein
MAGEFVMAVTAACEPETIKKQELPEFPVIYTTNR